MLSGIGHIVNISSIAGFAPGTDGYEYDYIRDFHGKFNAMDGKQIGDPNKIADALIKLVESEHPPVNLFLGSDAYKRAELKIIDMNEKMQQWKEVSISTDF